MLDVSKYGPGSGPHWKNNGSRYPALYRAIIKDTATGLIAPSLLYYQGRDKLILRVIGARCGSARYELGYRNEVRYPQT